MNNNKSNENNNQKPKTESDSSIITKPVPTYETFSDHSKENKK